ncbi:esterase/lipase family protein [Kribbella solani]|uniref:Pimeloyl-ACP methyl ester carboxylesterase n=1 Tax=Kribbella solani TaxID=236067 RepID=A0A841DP32_9ACTN|nr:alpha/beta fold hydrolase [Kribbella solani]MBB5978440.1 pimeloyl-ACP methyl ester carboxylesterase [Kribbella solani]
MVDVWEPFSPPAALRRREMLGWLGYLQAVGPRVPAVDARSGPVPVLTVPGFLTGDWSMIPLARHLRRSGHATFTSGITVNSGCTEMLVESLERRLEDVVAAAERPVVVVGQSRGGTLCRMVAVRRPELLAGVVTLASPLLHQLATTQALVHQVQLMARLNVCGWPWLLTTDCLSGGCAERTSALLESPWPAGLPFVSLYSRQDAVVDWHACLDPAAEHIEVGGTHNGMGTDRHVQRLLAAKVRSFSART